MQLAFWNCDLHRVEWQIILYLLKRHIADASYHVGYSLYFSCREFKKNIVVNKNYAIYLQKSNSE